MSTSLVPKDQGASLCSDVRAPTWAHGIQYLFFLHINVHLWSVWTLNSQQDEELMILIKYFITENLCSLQFYLSTAKHSLILSHTPRTNTIPLTHWSFSWCVSPQNVGTTFLCCLVAQPSSHHQHSDLGYCLLWDPEGHFSCRHSSKGQLTCSAGVRMNRKKCDEKPKLKLILIPGNLFSLIFNTSCKKGK